MAQVVLDRLKRKFGAAILETHKSHGDEVAVVESSKLVAMALFLRDNSELQFDMPIDCTAIDWLNARQMRFEVIYHLYSTTKKHRLRLKVPVSEQNPTCPSLTAVWPGMNWPEREAWDMYGISFSGHPDLRRILMYEEFNGHPLRKDYPIDLRQPLIELRQVSEVPTQRHPPADRLNKP